MQINDLYQRYLLATRFLQAAEQADLGFTVEFRGYDVGDAKHWRDLELTPYSGYLYDLKPNLGQYTLEAEQREALAEYLLDRFPELNISRRAGEIRMLGLMRGLRVEISLGTGVCEQVKVGERVIPARPAEPERVEDIYEYRCIDPIAAAGLAQ